MSNTWQLIRLFKEDPASVL
jgi:hypothetical protein